MWFQYDSNKQKKPQLVAELQIAKNFFYPNLCVFLKSGRFFLANRCHVRICHTIHSPNIFLSANVLDQTCPVASSYPKNAISFFRGSEYLCQSIIFSVMEIEKTVLQRCSQVFKNDKTIDLSMC